MNSSHGPRLPRPGLAWGAYPQREPSHRKAPAPPWWATLLATLPRDAGALAPAADTHNALAASLPPALAASFFQAQRELVRGVDEEARVRCRQALHREGLSPAAAGPALALAAHAFAQQLGQRPYPTQLLAAWLLLRGQFAEMATGEGKTLAMGLAAAVAALGGAPVHVLTANDYLAARDQALLAPAYAALGLTSAAVTAQTPPDARRVAYRSAIVHSTAREVGFDYLRDHLVLGGQRDPRTRRAAALAKDCRPAGLAKDCRAAALAEDRRAAAEPLLPGLCFALLDEADSLLLDEATVPLLLAQPGAALQPAEWHAAWAIAATLRDNLHFELRPELQRADLTGEGHAAVNERCNERTALRRRVELVQAALVARHLLQRNRHYTLTPQGIELIDEPTGRRAEGRRWAGHLYPMVQIKEGLPPSTPAVTAAQITYPRLFSRYLALAGMSGTLLEARRELLATYGKRVRRVPLAQPDRRRWLGTQLFVHTSERDAAVARRAAQLGAAGRPTLVGTGSVAAAQALCQRLRTAGLAPQGLHALHQAEEAALIAAAGRAGCLTVATNIAGRGTDIRLDGAAAAAGGLHVIATACNRSSRIDRQLIGRAARHGDPGSAEALLALDDPLLVQALPHGWRRLAAALATAGPAMVPRWLAAPLLAWARLRTEQADAGRRRHAARAALDIDEWLAFAGGPE